MIHFNIGDKFKFLNKIVIAINIGAWNTYTPNELLDKNLRKECCLLKTFLKMPSNAIMIATQKKTLPKSIREGYPIPTTHKKL